ncbi:hypothetical protein [Christiangramia echinicola]|uniref:hypothetical protein n=1 Tax=Christiangramia echinicola TaxID=279359 RepID=UPI000401EE67|nr:hypothetical protein [Christiangramia echinicola]
MLKKLFLVIGVLISASSFSQKDTREIIEANNIEIINIQTDEVYLISIISTKTSEIKINSHSEGEYFNDILLSSSIIGDELKITTNYPQKLAGGYDKLSAHKVFSLEIELEVPHGMRVNVSSNIASLKTKGPFTSIFAELKGGYCQLLDFSGDAVINTYSGNIMVETSAGLIEANSRNGKVDIPEILPGRNPLRLTSIDGNIKVLKN